MNLVGEKVKIRKVELGDAVLITAWKNDRFVKRHALGPQFKTTIEGERRAIINVLKSKSQLYLVICLQKNDHPIGYIRIDWLEKGRFNAWLRFVLGRSRGKGYAADAIRTLLRHLFSMNLHRVDAEVYEFNTKSIKLLHRLGFKTEGVRRKAHFDGKKYHDVIALGLLKQDFAFDADAQNSRK